MADLQKYFEQFHDAIRLDYEMNATLAEKRDIIVRRIRDRLKDAKRPLPDVLLQGSYSMRTGVVPIADLEYDIDVGLRFYFHESEYSAADVRAWVWDAVKDHTNSVEGKGPCLRITYVDGYHVDLVCYAVWTDDLGQDQYRLAHKSDGWLAADPPALLEHIRDWRRAFVDTKDGTGTDQFRRTVRYLKRWNDKAIPEERRDKPTGLAFTLLCGAYLAPQLQPFSGKSDDRAALESFARDRAQWLGRIEAHKPTPQYEDMFERLDDDEMEALKKRFLKMADALRDAGKEVDPRLACQLLVPVFGEDFPVPAEVRTAETSPSPAIIGSSASA